jgi:hypothetical protein
LWQHSQRGIPISTPTWVCASAVLVAPLFSLQHSLLHSTARPPRPQENESRTHFAETLRYMLDGVRNSAGIEEKTGTRFGGLGDVAAAARTSRTVSSDGWTTSCVGTRSVCRHGTARDGHCGLPEGPCWADTARDATPKICTVAERGATEADKVTVVLKPDGILASQSGTAMLLDSTQLPRHSRRAAKSCTRHTQPLPSTAASFASARHGSPTDFCS